MGAAEWSLVSGSLLDRRTEDAGSSCAAGATSGIETPPGSRTAWSYGVRQLGSNPGVRAQRAAQVDLAPMLKGGHVSAWMRRGTPGAVPFVFLGLQVDDVTESAYLLGLGADGHLVLRRGALTGGVPDVAPGPSAGVLSRSASTFALGAWVHLKLEVAVSRRTDPSLHPDVVVNGYVDLAGSSEDPDWSLALRVVDDALGIRTGAPPLVGGFVGFGVHLDGTAGGWAALTDLSITRQT
jgi:hypothetical protein